MALDMQTPEAKGLALEAIERPAWSQHRRVVLADRLPALAGAHAALMDKSDVVTDGGTCPLKPCPGVLPAFADRTRQHVVEPGLLGFPGGGRAGAGQDRQRFDLLGKFAEVVFQRSLGTNGDKAFDAALTIGRARDP